MKDSKYTLHDINNEIIKSADSYLRTVIINRIAHTFSLNHTAKS